MIGVGSLCSGIGAMDLGMERAGLTIRWQAEIDPYAQRILAKHWPHVRRYSDVRTLSGHELEPVDVIAAGFPCQPVSVAGKRRGQNDERWLWPDIARILRAVRPRFTILENTPGLLIRGMGDVLGDLAELGLDAEWRVLRACDFGAPHIRARVFLIAWCRQRVAPPGPASGFLADARHGMGWLAAQSRWPATTDMGEGDQALAGPVALPGLLAQHGVGDGPAARLDRDARLRGLGNAVVPAVAEHIARAVKRALEDA